MKQISNKSEFLRGVRTGIPILVGFFPVATTFAVLASQSGMSALETSAMSVMVLAGSSQIVAMQMLIAEAGCWRLCLQSFF